MDTEIRVSTEGWLWRKKFSCYFCWDSNSRHFDDESIAPPLSHPHSPFKIYIQQTSPRPQNTFVISFTTRNKTVVTILVTTARAQAQTCSIILTQNKITRTGHHKAFFFFLRQTFKMHSDNQSQRTNLKTNLKWPVILKVHVHTYSNTCTHSQAQGKCRC